MPTASLQSPVNLPPLRSIPGKVRLVKDCLRVGRWYLGDSPAGEPIYWDVTPELLSELVSNFSSQLAAGYPHNLQWGHPSPTLGNSEQLVIEYLSDLWAEGDTLYFAVYVTPETADLLSQKHRQVSVRVIPRFHPSDEHDWGNTLIHVAIVDHGAVPAQIPFVELSASLSGGHSVRVDQQSDFVNLSALGDNATDSESSKQNSGTKTMDFAKLVELINLLLSKVSDTARLPTEGDNAVTEETLVPTLSMICDVLGLTTTETETTEEAPPATDPGAGGAELSAFVTVLKSLDSRMQAFEARDLSNRKSAFKARAAELGAAGLPAKNVAALLAQGERTGWELSAFDAVEGIPGLKLGGQTKGHQVATPDDAAVNMARQRLGLPAQK